MAMPTRRSDTETQSQCPSSPSLHPIRAFTATKLQENWPRERPGVLIKHPS